MVVIIDSLSRLALGYRDTSRVKRIFGAGRELEGEDSGSLTVIATVLEDDEKGPEVRSALETTENVLIRLDAELAAQGIVPSLRVRRDPRLGGGAAPRRRGDGRGAGRCAPSSTRWTRPRRRGCSASGRCYGVELRDAQARSRPA